jgi:hypothetical protein
LSLSIDGLADGDCVLVSPLTLPVPVPLSVPLTLPEPVAVPVPVALPVPLTLPEPVAVPVPVALPVPLAPPDTEVSVDVDPLALPLEGVLGLCVSGTVAWPPAFVFTSTPTLGFTPTPTFGLTFGLMVVFWASAGPTPTTSAANEAAAIEAKCCVIPGPPCVLCGRVDHPLFDQLQAQCHHAADEEEEWSFYNERGAPSSRAMTVRWIWLVPS